MNIGRLGGAGWLLAVLLGLGGCGVPSDPSPRPLTTVPYNLLSPTSPAPPAPSTTASGRPLLYLVTDDTLTAVDAGTPSGGDPAAAISALLDRLAAGPTDQERARGLSTALGPDVRITLERLDGDQASIDIDAGEQVPSAGRVPLAVGQIVLSVTSLPGVATVVLTRDGQPIEAPLPGGALAAGPVAGKDYAEFLQPTTPSQPST